MHTFEILLIFVLIFCYFDANIVNRQVPQFLYLKFAQIYNIYTSCSLYTTTHKYTPVYTLSHHKVYLLKIEFVVLCLFLWCAIWNYKIWIVWKCIFHTCTGSLVSESCEKGSGNISQAQSEGLVSGIILNYGRWHVNMWFWLVCIQDNVNVGSVSVMVETQTVLANDGIWDLSAVDNRSLGFNVMGFMHCLLLVFVAITFNGTLLSLYVWLQTYSIICCTILLNVSYVQ